jgi:hypothetical protein
VEQWMPIFVISNKYNIVLTFILTFLLCTYLIQVLFSISAGIRTTTSDGAIYQSSTSFSHDCFMLFVVLQLNVSYSNMGIMHVLLSGGTNMF